MTPLLSGLILGFPPVHGGDWARGYTRRPPGRQGSALGRHRDGVGKANKDFSQPPTPPPRSSEVLRPTNRPQGRATMILTSSSLSPR